MIKKTIYRLSRSLCTYISTIQLYYTIALGNL